MCDATHTLVLREAVVRVRATVSGNLCCDKRGGRLELRSGRAALGRRAAGDRGGRLRPAPPRRGVRRRRPQRDADRPGGARQEHADRSRSPSSTPKPSGCCATGWPSCGPASRSSARRGRLDSTARDGRSDVGARSDRRHGELRLRDRRRTRCRWPSRSTARRSPARSPTSPTGEVYSAALGHGRARPARRHVDAVALQRPSPSCRWRWWAPDSATRREREIARPRCSPQLLPEVRDVRRIGSCALDLCMVAAGRLDAYYEDGVHVWDWAAGALIAAEAGARLRLPPVERAVRADRRGRGTGHRRGVRRRAAPRGRDLARVAAGQAIRLSRWRCGSSTAAPGRRAGWRPAAGSPARRRCRRCGVSSVKSVPIARSTVSSVPLVLVQLGARRDQPDRRGGGPPVGPKRIWPWHSSRVLGVDGSLAAVGWRESEVAQRAGHLGGLTALTAGVEHPDLGVGQFGGGDLGHRRRGDLLAELGLGRVGGLRVAGCRPRPRGRRRAIERDHPDDQRHDGERGEHDDAGHEVATAERATPFVEGRAFGDLRDHACTLRPASVAAC